eukprot:c1974_g1_i1.p1 GENE.c1974_g1_i1~~c1974_g1_i1.p1  ORF type:complete len:158 (+),score=46.24 c1974_g1_i1:29-502(+)
MTQHVVAVLVVVFVVGVWAETPTYAPFDHVQLVNLKTTDFNGKLGYIERRGEGNRWVIRISGESDTFAVKAENLVLVPRNANNNVPEHSTAITHTENVTAAAPATPPVAVVAPPTPVTPEHSIEQPRTNFKVPAPTGHVLESHTVYNSLSRMPSRHK